MPIDDDEDDDDDEEEDYDEPPLSPRSSNGFLPQEAFDDTSPRVSSDSKSLVVESETLSDTTPSFVPPSPSSVAALSQTASITRASDDSSSPQMYPTRLSVASRIQSDRSPLNTEFGDWDDRAVTNETPPKRNGEVTSTSTWGKVKNTFSRAGSGGGRRSRTNSIVTRERRDHTDSSISRESGASLTSTKTDRAESIGTLAHQQAQQPLMQSPSASASILSLAPHSGPRGGVSPVPPASSADLLKYQSSKLFPFPGMKKLEEQRNRAKGLPVVSASTPDVTFLPNGNDDDQPPHSSSSFSNTPAQTPEMGRDRRLSHQASDTRLLAKYNLNSPPISATPSSTSHPDYINITPPHIPSQTTSSINLKLPMTLPGVKQWLSKNNRKIFSSQGSSSPPSSAPISSPVEFRTSPNASKKPSLSDLLRIKKDNELGTDWEEIGSEKSRTPTSASGSTLLGKQLAATDIKESIRESIPPRSVNQVRTDHVDTEKTSKTKQVAPTPELNGEAEVHLRFDPPLTVTLPPEPPSSMTPDPSSSLSDYPAPSTSESSSTTSSQYSQYATSGNARSQGAVVLERLDENLARGPRSPMWADAIDDPARKLLRSIPVLQVVNPNTVKDRFLFLFSDLLVIAKPVIQDQDNIMDSYKPTPLDRKFIVKSVVLLRQLRFSGDRAEPQTKTTSYAAAPRNPLIRTFVHQFAKDADHAISSLFDKAGIQDDPIVLGQLLFKTLDLDRVRLGDYLSRRTSKVVLKAYVDSFGFTGMRVDRALRVFLYSINVPVRSSHNHSPLDYLLDAFASRWYEANARIVAYDKDLAIRLVRALVQLNELLHDGISQEPGSTNYPKRNITSRDFLEAFRRYDVRYLVSDELLEDVYESVLEEKLSQARNTSHGGPSDVTIMIKRPLPTRLTYKVQSDPIILRIPQADPQLTIQLYGQDLIFEPSVLSFTKSLEASFRVMGTSLGSKTMIMCRSGPNALRYFGLPLSNSLMVERAFMRNTFQLAFSNHNGMKRRYMFSVDDPLIRHDWVIELKRQIDNATSLATAPSSPGASKFHRAAEHIAFKILQETLIGASPPDPLDKALQRLNSSPRHTLNGSPSRFLVQQRAATTNNARLNGFRFGPSHVRSKSRSQVYHRLGAGKNELDLNHNGTDSRGSREVDNNGREESTAMYDYDQPSRVEGPIWSGRDLAMQCQQNSSIALVLSFLQVGAPDHDQGSS
jgi:serine/arginine repetitive matrix protein 2